MQWPLHRVELHVQLPKFELGTGGIVAPLHRAML